MSTTWITATSKTTNAQAFRAAAWIETVADRFPRTGTAGCALTATHAPGKLECTDAYATVKGALPAAFIEFDSLESTEASKASADRPPTFKVSVNSALAQQVKPGPLGFSVIVFTSGRELTVSGDAPVTQAALAAA